MRESRLPAGGVNLFQEIKAVCSRAEANGRKLYRLSIGQPTGPALLTGRKAAAEAVMSEKECVHEYQDNGSPACSNFALRFCNAHVKCDLAALADDDKVSFLPIPGIKPTLGLIPSACGASDSTVAGTNTIPVMVSPGYPTPHYGCQCLGDHQVICQEFTLNQDNGFLFSPDEIRDQCADGLVMMNYPHNPTSQVANRAWLEKVCRVCSDRNIRIFNDAAYAMLAHSDNHCTLTDVAVHYPNLSWAEAFSSSKAGNFTGWRVAALTGSPDFVGDIATINGNTNSGVPGPLMLGVIAQIENGRGEIEAVRVMYFNRIRKLTAMLKKAGMRLAVEPGAGFFTVWQTPTRAFEQDITSAKQFNFAMIDRTGIVGVHFEPDIRYAVVGDIDAMANTIEKGFTVAEVSYN